MGFVQADRWVVVREEVVFAVAGWAGRGRERVQYAVHVQEEKWAGRAACLAVVYLVHASTEAVSHLVGWGVPPFGARAFPAAVP
ncbi:hypothetical protein GCM10010342_19030 [Streptomyces anulatus]|nr:hypothetical protein GCM10010342_19030 [Streptomyces anulatus]